MPIVALTCGFPLAPCAWSGNPERLISLWLRDPCRDPKVRHGGPVSPENLHETGVWSAPEPDSRSPKSLVRCRIRVFAPYRGCCINLR